MEESQVASKGNTKKGEAILSRFFKPSSRVQLFLFLNDLAGRWPLLDEVARFFYIGALPALGTLLLAQLLILPRSGTGVSRSKTALALVLAVILGALLTWGFDLVAGWLHLGNLSPRPWMTRRVNWLVVEPQDNSFPCIELVLVAAVACASWKLSARWGIVSWVVVVLLALTRLFCGNNYFADVFVGGALGASAFILCSQLCQRHLGLGQRAREFSLSASPLTLTLVSCYLFALLSPRFQGKLGIGRPATAAPVTIGAHSTATSVTQGEGEGEGMEPADGAAEELALAKRSTLFLPEVEAFLRGKLTSLARPFTLLDVEVAPVKAGSTSYRCAAIRIEVPAEQQNMRQVVADRAARLVQTAFALDSQLQNVDVIAVSRDEGRNLDGSLMTFVGDEVPVFTASIQRQKLVVTTPEWANVPGLDGLSWLRARSRLYINARALPDAPEPAVDWPTDQLPSINGTPLPQYTPRPSGTPSLTSTPAAQKTPSRTPIAATTPKAGTPTPSASPHPNSTSRPQVQGTPKATPQHTTKPTPRTTTTALPKATPQHTTKPIPHGHVALPTASPKPLPTRTVSTPVTNRTPRPTPTRTVAGTPIRP
ncbi:phosphatase PAP2 family protein [bacterium]|nr:MAG: phosphatase PAP2 family protein [bacterium]